MYKSPISVDVNWIVDKITEEVTDKQNSLIVEAAQKIGITVDPEELFKALQYDRGQYRKGYREGHREGYKAALADMAGFLEQIAPDPEGI